jgi:hypothetical protein
LNKVLAPPAPLLVQNKNKNKSGLVAREELMHFSAYLLVHGAGSWEAWSPSARMDVAACLLHARVDWLPLRAVIGEDLRT